MHQPINQFREVVRGFEANADPYLRAYYAHLDERLDNDEQTHNLVANFLTDATGRRQLSYLHAANLFFRAMQAVEMARDEKRDNGKPRYPRGKEQPEAWRETFDYILDPAGDVIDHFTVDLSRSVQSNIADRGKLLRVVQLLHHKDEQATILEIGCSQNHILKKAALHQNPAKRGFRYGHTEVMQHPPDQAEPQAPRQPVRPAGFDIVRTEVLNKLIQDRRRATIGQSLGIDIWDPYRDSAVALWARSCSFYPSELLDDRYTRDFDRLTREQPPEAGFYHADFGSNFDHERFEARFPGSKNNRFDLVFIPTMLYQLSGTERQAVIANAAQRVRPDGLVVVQDYVQGVPDKSDEVSGLEFYGNAWPDYSYSLWVWDMQQPDQGWQKYFDIESGRVRRIVIAPAVGQLAAARELGLVMRHD